MLGEPFGDFVGLPRRQRLDVTGINVHMELVVFHVSADVVFCSFATRERMLEIACLELEFGIICLEISNLVIVNTLLKWSASICKVLFLLQTLFQEPAFPQGLDAALASSCKLADI